MTLPQLQQLKKVYEGEIKKDPSFVLKSFLQPWYSMPVKPKSVEKRITQVEIKKSILHILSILDPNHF